MTKHDEKKVKECHRKYFLLTRCAYHLGSGHASGAKYPSTSEMEVSHFKLFTLQADVMSFFRKELQYMLHSRRKAEIEILSSSLEVDVIGPKPWVSAKHSEPHALLLRYITSKLDYFVQAAGDRNR